MSAAASDPERDVDAASPASTAAIDAARRILDATLSRLARLGSQSLSLQDIAADAGVSKALIHYHFRDKDALLARAVHELARGVLARERHALDAYASRRSPLAIDALWEWLERELALGAIRSLGALADYPTPAVRRAWEEATSARLTESERTVERLFEILDLRPRIAPSLLAHVVVAFVDGLALGTMSSADGAEGVAAAADARVAFDVFWLAMLSLAQ